ncbi:hypothetical protein HBI56_087120 [Parastagonospora nodorum]|uniref:Uncharacterized protein n=2 Tax=Phaeosphaeria nodorum (strain SN15 / ATCC MYA-4574 / FGSC 10173) TaxID=321614 RepID=Q0UD87_PHANO|nr:hypothetical protein SNOG_10277 [Parastagonospora nodorum SN15]KAH3913152.1 hypothetical protein HBH56_112370 [Parastagonospora nodorum]EAT82612.1 hypothetical protein SNOG_10277 [Parastagonospora nodorum SN15]KAH3925642.1 hypothetical protein HBH54_177980 [Parastagonospora nodorum]KAH3974306.1 hypothetical protein HBH51_090190 [Parastagonospora nodorum]KAH3979266.1 hypothetical protein HBH52_098190 [Parastagonospora nodorum]
MHFSTLTSILLAATGINAAALSKRVDSIPLNIYTGTGCNQGRPITTAFVPADGSCFGIAPILSGNTDSGLIDDTILKTLPKGCTLLVYSDFDCTSVNFINYDATGRCGTFGPGLLIHSARAVGTCA